MDSDKIVETLRDCNHMIELDFKTLPRLSEDDQWATGWVRFHDTLTGNMVCVNQKNKEDPQEPVGTVVVSSNMDVTIPPNQVVKYLTVESMKSASLPTVDLDFTEKEVETPRMEIKYKL